MDLLSPAGSILHAAAGWEHTCFLPVIVWAGNQCPGCGHPGTLAGLQGMGSLGPL